ncbi:hypothetical protein S40288_11006 [Stachybotrys chartarum IBT 40288]|nr:hypothetical protein S40288_11006 [Stachybotrys chartarum IBT 40288]
MHLIAGDEELSALAKKVECASDDLTLAPDAESIRRLPIRKTPATAHDLARCFYDRKRNEVVLWAERKDLCIHKKHCVGPQVGWLRKLRAPGSRVTIFVVIQNPHQDKVGDSRAPRAGNEPQRSRVKVYFRLPVAGPVRATSSHQSEVGDVVILEEDEEMELAQDEGNRGSVWLLTIQHQSSKIVGEGALLEVNDHDQADASAGD